LRKLLGSKAAGNVLGAGAQSLAAKYFTGETARPIRWLNKGRARRKRERLFAPSSYLQSNRCNQRSCFRVVARTNGPPFHSSFLRSAQFSMQNGATGRKKTFDL